MIHWISETVDSGMADLVRLGGKGLGLCRLQQLGFSVPPAFIITMPAYHAFLEANDLRAFIDDVCATTNVKKIKERELAAQHIQLRFEQGVIPASLTHEIIGAYKELRTLYNSLPIGETHTPRIAGQLVEPMPEVVSGLYHHDTSSPFPPVAVRSSATFEDLNTTSAAGQQESFLQVVGDKQLLTTIKACWASLWSPRAIAYRETFGLTSRDMGLAVIVQCMVAPEAAGTLFTRNPITGAEHELVINATWGLGTPVVAGTVTPDLLVFDKQNGAVLEHAPGAKQLVQWPGADQLIDQHLPAEYAHLPALTPRGAEALLALGRQVERQFGAAQDLEWAIAHNRIWCLQARPITDLSGRIAPHGGEVSLLAEEPWPAVGEYPAQPFDVWTRANVGEAWQHPISPLTWSLMPSIFGRAAYYPIRMCRAPYLTRIQWVKRFYGRVYYNEGAMAHVLSHEFGLPSSLVESSWGSRTDSSGQAQPEISVIHVLRRFPALLRQTVDRFIVERTFESLFTQIDHWLAQFRSVPLASQSDAAIFAALSAWHERFIYVLSRQIVMTSTAMPAYALLEHLVHRWTGRTDVAPALITGLSDVYAADIAPAVTDLAQHFRKAGLADLVLSRTSQDVLAYLAEAPEQQVIMDKIQAFLAAYGHRCPNEEDWIYPRWVEEPGQIIALIAVHLRQGDAIPVVGGTPSAIQQRDTAGTIVNATLNPVQRIFFRMLLKRVQRVVRLRDNGKHYLMKVLLPLCQGYRELGQRWSARGPLSVAEDIFYLAHTEIESIVSAHTSGHSLPECLPTIMQRRHVRQAWHHIEAPPVLDAHGQPVLRETIQDDHPISLQGLAASGGKAQGKARVLQSIAEVERLQPGDILVARALDPGWTPLFPLLAGVVVEIGGQLSHVAVVAREYGLPAVVNVPGATHMIADGQELSIDGTTGVVLLL